MKNTKKRWFVYIIVGVLFGIFDIVYQEFIQTFNLSESGNLLIACLIWLVPIVPAVIYEVKTSFSIKRSVSTAVVIWCTAVVSYYVFLAFKLIFIGQDSMDFLYISHYKDPFYMRNLLSVFLGDVLSGILEWIGLALAGGSVMGFVISYIYLKVTKKL